MERERESESVRQCRPLFCLSLISSLLCVGCAPIDAMVTAFLGGIQVRGSLPRRKENYVERVNVVRSDVDKDTMSAAVKLAKEVDELDIGQPTAECQLMTLSERRLVTRGELRPAQGGAEDTEERVYGMVSLMTSSRDQHDKLWRALLSCSLSTRRL